MATLDTETICLSNRASWIWKQGLLLWVRHSDGHESANPLPFAFAKLYELSVEHLRQPARFTLPRESRLVQRTSRPRLSSAARTNIDVPSLKDPGVSVLLSSLDDQRTKGCALVKPKPAGRAATSAIDGYDNFRINAGFAVEVSLWCFIGGFVASNLIGHEINALQIMIQFSSLTALFFARYCWSRLPYYDLRQNTTTLGVFFALHSMILSAQSHVVLETLSRRIRRLATRLVGILHERPPGKGQIRIWWRCVRLFS